MGQKKGKPPEEPEVEDIEVFTCAYVARIDELGFDCEARPAYGYVSFAVSKTVSTGAVYRQTFTYRHPPNDEEFGRHMADHAVASLLGR